MIAFNTNSKFNDLDLAPWTIEADRLGRAMVTLKTEGLNLPIGEIKDEVISKDKVFLVFDRKDLTPKLVPSTSDLSYRVTINSHTLADNERVVMVKPEGAYLLEWHYYSLSRHFDYIVAHRAGKPTAITIFIANDKGQVRTIKHERDGDKLSRTEKNFYKDESIDLERKFFIQPYRPLTTTTNVLVHIKNLESAKKVLGDRYTYHTFTNLKSMRKAAAKLAQETKAATLYFNEEGVKTLNEDQKFFSRAVSEYFSLINIAYNNGSASRYYFTGKSTILNRKNPKAKKKKPNVKSNKRPGKPNGKPTNKPSNKSGDKPFFKGKKPNGGYKKPQVKK